MPRPTSAPAATTRAPRRIQSTDVLRRSARRNSSGTRIVGRKNASRGPWKTAVRRGRASPMPGGFASSTTVVSTRFGRASVPTSTTAYSAAGYPSFSAAASALRAGGFPRRRRCGRRVLRESVQERHDAGALRVDQDLPLLFLLGPEETDDPVRQRQLAFGEAPERLRPPFLDDVPRGLVRELRNAAFVLRMRRAHGLVVGEPGSLVRHGAPVRRIDPVHPQEAVRDLLGAGLARLVFDVGRDVLAAAGRAKRPG